MDTQVGIPEIYVQAGCNASGAGSTSWHVINWGTVARSVKSLQIRVAKAVAAKQWRKVKRIQWLITHSFASKMLAVKRVTENQGKRTAGIDGETWKTAEDKTKAVQKWRLKGYQPQAVRRIYIPKSNGQKRPLGIPTMHDRAMQALYLLRLDPVSESTADVNSYGFRPHRSCADAIAQCFNVLSPKKAPQWILEGDIKGCFDNISPDWMLENIPISKKPLQQWLQSGFIETGKLFPTISGTPQGSIISPTLANRVLDGLAAHIDAQCPIRKKGQSKNRIQNPHQIHFIRYADDFIGTRSDKDSLKDPIIPVIQTFLNPRGLELSETKTQITPIEQGFDFLGQKVRKYDGTLLIKPSKKNVKTFLEKVQRVIHNLRDVPTRHLIKTLNPMIRGWAMYHRHIVAKRIFSTVDHKRFQMTWRWAKRRHLGRRKNKRWIKNRSFTRIKGRDWLLFDRDVPLQKEKDLPTVLFQASSVPIQRHLKVKSYANPYSSTDEPYFEFRTQLQMSEKWEGRRLLDFIFKRQHGKCAYCGEPIDLNTGWHVHHIQQRILGGKNTEANLVILHPNCHTSVHVNRFSFAPTQPRPPNGKRSNV
jgi:RNA-directed DNA polymerase